jgi:phosphoribosylformylglycinamidine synthase subunit PurQ / glutaminase
MNSAIVVFPGSNREQDARAALLQATGREPALVWHRDTELPDVDLILIPGGFSYGDYLRCGAMAAHSPVMREVAERAKKGVAVLGVCNGFQVLAEAGLLPGALLRNAGLKFVCRNVTLKVENSQTLFTSGYEKGQTLSVPVAHGEGNYFAEEATLDRLEERGQIAFRYVDGNPNGSARDIAGVFNETKNVLGMMPHPENAIDPLQGSTDGFPLFSGLVQALS